MPAITPNLWFDTQAEEAAEFYVSIFPNSHLGEKMYHTASSAKVSNQLEGALLTVSFSLNGQEFIALNGGPQFTFNESVSFMIACEDQAEIDYYWEKLTEGGQPSQCGWLKDKYGVSWQVVPAQLDELIRKQALAQEESVMKAMLEMTKIDWDKLQKIAQQ